MAATKGFPGGIDNISPETQLRPGAARALTNVDIDRAGKPHTREGRTQRVSGSARGLFGGWDYMLGIVDHVLYAYDANLTGVTIRSGIANAPISYAIINGKVFWTDGAVLRRITPNLADQAAWIDCPGQPNAAAYATGGLTAGDYQVAITYATASGEESGSSLASVVTVAEGGGILLTGIPANTVASKVRIYVSPPNGDALYHMLDVAAGTTTTIVGTGTPGKLLATQWLEPMPAGQHVRFLNGRMYVARQNVLWESEPFTFGLKHYANCWRFSDYIDVLEPVGSGEQSGMYIATGKRTLFFSGPAMKDWRQSVARPSGAVEGTGCSVPSSWFNRIDPRTGDPMDGGPSVPMAFWIDRDGVMCVGSANGAITTLTEGRTAMPKADMGAVLLRERPGFRQLIASLIGNAGNSFGASDAASAVVRRHGVTIE
jgi:hypothetical protein